MVNLDKAYSSREIIKILKADGWVHKNTEGDHYHFKHPTKKGKVSVPHPKKDIRRKTRESIFKQAGLI
ncbi:type II toxin-antitoxin system HicA family toxin [Paenibacillus alvei]|uniref:Type II toxin-antitoxin system HicA family toxin n=1 Tax=Paenibacillus alvei TaxID=44250 RepID=A0AAP7A0Z6_PAEAL|nr:type II toxin-antitoxin system HicA family toxin [Paenibacillus alvei]EJW20039.1 putative lipoprotein [Paenibacillus alvei DSM 29]MCY9543372.1 type II toxin-antitoxin system HicA family toxin [Paenibacillus alvei]MCY9704748.1 type II toxin-antitoxin system HicA family toxin [Paenibacillus alvei]MCY9733699.1 type II toxin-antitoxin system HicA family toxin [Paenibacillus alvei]MCY9755510.1 type II toxin-antitoxin system HicA family toxin [Paenibacillus alvei]